MQMTSKHLQIIESCINNISDDSFENYFQQYVCNIQDDMIDEEFRYYKLKNKHDILHVLRTVNFEVDKWQNQNYLK